MEVDVISKADGTTACVPDPEIENRLVEPDILLAVIIPDVAIVVTPEWSEEVVLVIEGPLDNEL